MKTTVCAYNETGAKKIIQEKIIYHKVVKKEDDLSDEDVKDFLGNNDTFDRLMDIFGMGNDSNK